MPEPTYDESIGELIQSLSDMIENNTANDADLVKKVCEACMLSRISGTICEQHKQAIPSLRNSNCEICTHLLSGEEQEFAGRAELVSSMTKALTLIESTEKFANLIPQVRMNLVACDDNSKTTDDVLAIPGRITIVEGHARALVSPRFGASKHTATLLLWAKSKSKYINACICIIGNESNVKIAKNLGFNITTLSVSTTKVDEIVENTNGLAPKKSWKRFGIHVPGGIGIESILYLYDENINQLVNQTIKIAEKT
jgi:predicted fused transcriptional regulator/phosphomethylpyrimidine kinase